MNKGYFIALMLFFSVPAAFGWDLVINNMTVFEAAVEINYGGWCKADHVVIPAGQIRTIKARGCSVAYMQGAIVTVPGDNHQNISIEKKSPIESGKYFSAAIVDRGDGKYVFELTHFGIYPGEKNVKE